MIRIGVIGIDEVSTKYLELLKKIGGYKISGIYDSNWEKTKNLAKKYGIPFYYEPELLIESSDALVISGIGDYYNMAVESVKSAKHIFISFPFCKLEESERLIKLICEADVKVQVAHPYAGIESFKASIPFVKSPLFIELVNDYRMEDDITGANIYRCVAYDLSLLLYIVKSGIKRIYSNGFSIKNGDTDIISARIEFRNGCIANYTNNRIIRKSKHKCLIHQKNEILSINFNKNVSKLYLNEKFSNRLKKKNIFNYTSFNGTRKLMKKELFDFLEYINDGKTPLIDIEEYHYSMQLAFEIAGRINRTMIKEEHC